MGQHRRLRCLPRLTRGEAQGGGHTGPAPRHASRRGRGGGDKARHQVLAGGSTVASSPAMFVMPEGLCEEESLKNAVEASRASSTPSCTSITVGAVARPCPGVSSYNYISAAFVGMHLALGAVASSSTANDRCASAK
jgi:hypothetical protein